MPHLHYTISPEVFTHHPAYLRGVLVFDQLNNQAPANGLQTLLRQAEASARAAVPGNVAEFPPVAAWRDAYRRFGAKPSEHRSAIEALLRRVIKPDPLPQVNPLVDIGNLVSVQHLLPAGVHPLVGTGVHPLVGTGVHPLGGTGVHPLGAADAAGAAGSEDTTLHLRPAREGDTFLPPDGGAAETVPAGEIVLARGNNVLTRRWTWRQAAGTRIEAGTRCVFVNIDGLPPTSRSTVEAAMQQVQSLVAEHCGGRLRGSAVLSAEQPHWSVEFSA